ncbi:MAG: TlpA disulfide reductase family protein [Woeseiaceae bacterium]|jgi:peroxiredoxin
MEHPEHKPHVERSHRIRSFLLNVAMFLAVFLAATAFMSRNMLPADGKPAPELRGTTLAGETYDLAGAEAQPVLVYFFAPWCRICGASADNLSRLSRWRGDKIEIVAVALDWTTEQEVRDYAARHELGVTVVLGDGAVRERWQVRAYPSYYVLDRDHRVLRRDVGYSSQFGLWWRAWTVG